MHRVERVPGDRGGPGPCTGGPPSTGSPRPLHTRPSQPSPTGTRSGSPAKVTRVPPGHQALGALEDLDHGEVAVHLEHQAVPVRTGPVTGRR